MTTHDDKAGDNKPSDKAAGKDDPHPPPRDTPTSKLTEADFLLRQAEDAKAALTQALRDAAGQLAQGVNPAQWTQKYPWITLGASAVAGFVATSLLVPSKEQQALAKLAAIERALNPPPPRRERSRDDHPADSGGVDADPNAKNYRAPTGFLSLIAREAIGAIKPALVSLLTAGVTAKAAKPSEEEMEAAAAHEDQKQAAGGGDPSASA